MSNHLEVGSGFVYRAILNLDINISKTDLDSKSEVAKKTSQMCSSTPTDQITRSKFGHNFEFDLSPFMRKHFKKKNKLRFGCEKRTRPLFPICHRSCPLPK